MQGAVYDEPVRRAVDLILSNDPAAGKASLEVMVAILKDQSGQLALPAEIAFVVACALDTVVESDVPSPDQLVQYGLRWFPRSPLVQWSIATAELRRGCGYHAYQSLLELESMAEEGDYDQDLPVPRHFLKEGLWERLATVAEALGKTEVAKRNYDRLIAANPRKSIAIERRRALI